MGQKASLHMSPLKGMDAAQGGENERRDWDKERYDRKEDSHGNINHYDWYRRKLNFEVVHGKSNLLHHNGFLFMNASRIVWPNSVLKAIKMVPGMHRMLSWILSLVATGKECVKWPSETKW